MKRQNIWKQSICYKSICLRDFQLPLGDFKEFLKLIVEMNTLLRIEWLYKSTSNYVEGPNLSHSEKSVCLEKNVLFNVKMHKHKTKQVNKQKYKNISSI